MADVFISYSRKDQEFARRLHGALTAQGHDVWVDWEDIPLTAEWLKEIYRGIEEAGAFVFVISPDSLASEVCRQEVDYALANNKRIIPVVRREVDYKHVPHVLSRHNWIFFRDGDDFET